MILTPEGEPAGNIDRIMLLAFWTKHLQNKPTSEPDHEFICAGMGKPTFPMNAAAAQAGRDYFETILHECLKEREILLACGKEAQEKKSNLVVHSVSDYGHPQGEEKERIKMANALNQWYDNEEISKEDILFTVGGAGSLYTTFKALKQHAPGAILTPFPHYTLYHGPDGKNRLFPIDLMQAPGYRLTATLLETHLKQAAEKNIKISAFLWCDPNNPLGTASTQEELEKIAAVLRQYPDIWIILDGAYEEMRFDAKHLSLFSVAPDLKNRMVMLRSATKALSAAGERMAVTVVFNKALRAKILDQNIQICGHAPRADQHIFAEAMSKLDAEEQNNLINHYKPKVDYVSTRLKEMAATMPDPDYNINGTFYVLADFSDLIGLDLPPETKQILNKEGKIETDEDLIYYLLVKDHVMVAPLSYFGVDATKGFVRITCSNNEVQQEEMMQRLETRLIYARKIQSQQLDEEITAKLEKLKILNIEKYQQFQKEFLALPNILQNTAADLKTHNLAKKTLGEELTRLIENLEKFNASIFHFGNHPRQIRNHPRQIGNHPRQRSKENSTITTPPMSQSSFIPFPAKSSADTPPETPFYITTCSGFSFQPPPDYHLLVKDDTTHPLEKSSPDYHLLVKDDTTHPLEKSSPDYHLLVKDDTTHPLEKSSYVIPPATSSPAKSRFSFLPPPPPRKNLEAEESVKSDVDILFDGIETCPVYNLDSHLFSESTFYDDCITKSQKVQEFNDFLGTLSPQAQISIINHLTMNMDHRLSFIPHSGFQHKNVVPFMDKSTVYSENSSDITWPMKLNG